LANRAVLVGGEREGELEFLFELVVARDRIARHADDFGLTLAKSSSASRKAQASAVQPDVSSLG
jgi:hypothetical protein